MRTVVGPEPVVQAWLDERHALGQDGRDEVWEGTYHVAPHEHARNGVVAVELAHLLRGPAQAAGLRAGGAFNLGQPDDFRVPDLGFHRDPPDLLYMPTAPLVAEVLSPDDETFAKFGFYAGRGVEELWVADPVARSIRIWALRDGAYEPVDRSGLLTLVATQVAEDLDWP